MATAGAYQSITVGVRDLDRALAFFRDIIQLRVEWEVAASADLARAWGLPGRAIRLVELSCAGYPVGRLRLASYDPPATEAVRLDARGGPDTPYDIGPKAIDFYVHKPMAEALAEIEAAGYPPRSRPIRHVIGETESEELVLTGPDGVPVLIMIGHRHAPTSHRTTGPMTDYSEIATVSVVSGPLEASRRFYREGMGLTATTDAEVPDEYRDIVDDLTGVERGTRIHFIVFQDPTEPSGKYLLVHFFEKSTRRLNGRMRPGMLGVSLFTHEVDDVDALVRQLTAAGGTLVSGPAEITFAPFGRRRHALVRGPNEELFELVSRAEPAA